MEVHTYLANLGSALSRPGLERIEIMLAHLGHPERDLSIIHVVGTNGKGSTAQFIASALQAADQKVGLFTSPHLVKFNERIQINGMPITDEALDSIFRELYPCLEELGIGAYGSPGMFEVATALALKHFSVACVDYAILEAGMGGRYDATHVGSPVVTVFTHIDLDHTEILGETVELIAAEKADVIPPGGTVVTAPQSVDVKRVITGVAKSRGARVIDIETEYEIERALPQASGTSFSVSRKGHWRHLRISLLGLFQITNAVTALATLDVLAEKGLGIGDAQVAKGLATASWPGRLEVVGKDPLVVLDGAHNLDGCRQLAATLPLYFSWDRLHLIMSIVGKKPVRAMLEALLPLADTVTFTAPQTSRTRPIDSATLKELAGEIVEFADNVPTFHDAYQTVRHRARPHDLVCVCGSLYLVSEARKQLVVCGCLAGIMHPSAENNRAT
ncbi:MAG: bifunctional folylpolyglutamate synthase/dihydrofolate synthase [Firmicutes bacterium]|jgi:dihydrofolate synthase/folylpolyglutamate synthase|nr:bifunctional folylpolyglutamate synthase/dihydrofolate synthase [Bacillota bacterium]